ncbi:MAG: Rap1a/Tai family immunity protein [Novosphingobium sp.]|uniref:Rap1a/Tai family immunity protein n=1 Tax=Novosphingobium sp. TaxID=1874826 RepID=UPI003C7A74C2
MLRVVFLVFAVALTFESGSVSAQERPAMPMDSGNTFLQHCRDANSGKPGVSSLDFGLCYGYLAGIVDGDSLGEHPHVCRPNGVTNGQAMDVVLKFLEDNPADRHYSAGPLVLLALMKAFPCPTAVPSK